MLSICLILSAVALLALSGFPACLLSPRSPVGQGISVALMLGGSVLGLAGVAVAFGQAVPPELRLPWFLPWGEFSIAVDPLSAFFLVLVFLVPALGSVYGLGYWKQAEHQGNGRRLGLFYGLLAASMAMVLVSRDALLFLIAWETMAISAWFAATAEDEDVEVRKAGWVYLIATHIGTLCLIAMFISWGRESGGLALERVLAIPEKAAASIFALALLGFGFKAGIMPLHVWLPGAHANAPSHVSAVMSGVMLKMGIYGIVRMTSLLPETALWWGVTLLAVGAITGIAGIAFAIGQNDLKRLLAYSSIENVGIIAMGLGLALMGRFLGRWDWILLGLGGALFHVWNHGLFKSLLFFGAGAVIHSTHTRNINVLGGLARKMPRTMFLFLAGAVAICALPPLNGFVGEWLLYLGFFRGLGEAGEHGTTLAASGAVALAMIGALAVACFVKLFGTVFLGAARSAEGERAHDPGTSMLAPMAVVALLCAIVGLYPRLVLPLLESAVGSWATPPQGAAALESLAPTGWISAMGIGLVLLVLAIVLVSRIAAKSRAARRSGTWDCGYARPTARMQYTGSSFGQSLVWLFGFFLRQKKEPPIVAGAMPREAEFRAAVPDLVLDRMVMPSFIAANRLLPKIRIVQQGQTHMYMLYILIITIILLVFGGLGLQS